MAGLPRLVQPMLATLRHRLPADEVRYGWEFKWDGVRAVAYVSGTQVRLLSRTGNEMTASYPELDVLAGSACSLRCAQWDSCDLRVTAKVMSATTGATGSGGCRTVTR